MSLDPLDMADPVPLARPKADVIRLLG